MARKKAQVCKKKTKKYLYKLEGFESLLSHFEKFEKVLEASIFYEDLKYQLGSFVLTLHNTPNNYEAICICIRENSSECFVCWKEVADMNNMQVDTNSEQAVEPKVAFSYGNCLLSFELLVSLSIKRVFKLVVDSNYNENNSLNLKVFINPNSISLLSHPAQPYYNMAQVQVQMVVEHFCGITIENYTKEFVEEEKHIEKIYQCIKNSYNSSIVEQISHPLLIPQLRPYQCQAVKWMLDCETRPESKTTNDNELHILYEELNLCNGTKIYYQKYSGLFVENKFLSLPLCKGGILADEMGLGKTVEVFALILLHPRSSTKKESQNLRKISDPSEDMDVNTETEVNSSSKRSISFECICGLRRGHKVSVCNKCKLAQHPKCMLYDPSDTSIPYLCPYCLVDSSQESIQSGSTLIISPSAILHQWENEVKKHIVPKNFKVFVYLGVEHQLFVNPKTLASYDIVITSYEVLRREFSHVDIPYGKEQRIFRNPKKFRALPSPLPAVEWWRVCLDEAQMVEGVSSKVAKLALKLKCVNRWCVTGTPIQKSVEDLYGLLLFLGYDPYEEKKWWTKLLCEPFANSVTDPLSSVLNKVLWRTDKDTVLNQMKIPKQEIKLYELKLSEVENVFYYKILDACRSDFLENIRKYNCEYSKLKAVDKQVLGKILLPLKKVEQDCCYFQLPSNVGNDGRCKMTIPELLEHLLKNATLECEEMHRKKLLDLNGLAGTQALKQWFKEACDTYNRVIDSAEENKTFVKTDSFQLIHTLHNYVRTIKNWQESGEDTESLKTYLKCDDVDKCCQDLSDKCSNLCKKYFIKFEENTRICKNSLLDIKNEIKDLENKITHINISKNDTWWMNVLNNLDYSEQDNFISKIKEHFVNFYGPLHFLQDTWTSLFNSFTNTNGLIYCLVTASEAFHEARKHLEELVLDILRCPTQCDVMSAAECHLRPIPNQRVTKCIYCKVDDAFKKYESKLFHFKEEMTEFEDETADEEDICFKQSRKGTHTDSEFETCIKYLGNYCHHNKDCIQYIELFKIEVKLFEVFKKEFKALRNAWLNASEYVASLDEIEMAKTSLRLPLPGEEINNPSPHIVLPFELDRTMWQFESSASFHQSEFKKKLGQLFYLQNLKKTGNENGPFEESCPVCRIPFERFFTALRCGHNFCWNCIETIRKNLGVRCSKLRCPVCREETHTSDIYYMEPTSNHSDVKGNYSTKVTALIECLLKIQKKNPTDKSLVFSSWKNLLSILENALKENGLNYVSLCDKYRVKFQEAIDMFKNDADCTVLLLPLKIGANGLNLVEASHVLIAEPLLNHSQILQAIGRVHRIGQTKETTVHEFVVKNTIEENIHRIHKNSPSEEKNDDSLTVQDLKQLFDSHL